MPSFTQDAALQELGSEEMIELMNAIDNLRSQAFQRELDLPQIIVCGSQSSGKSSVLEAISRFPFPAGDGLTTKFATEIALRSGPEESMIVAIEPGPGTSQADIDRLRQRSQKLQAEASQSTDTDAVLTSAIKEMNDQSGRTAFSPHRLRIQLCGPQYKTPLTLIDLPGLIATTARAAHEKDIAMVRDMVKGYMEQPRSIILAVAPATIDPETQPIFQLARDVDPHVTRTMGILTMPDRVQAGAEQAFIDWAMNKKIKLELGWHVLRNLHSSEMASSLRDEHEEAFFNDPSNPWKVVPGSQRGIRSLRPKLGRILFQHISSSLPALTREIDVKISNCQRELESLGPSRRGRNEQIRYLEKLCAQFRELVAQGIDGSYEEPFFQQSSDVFSEAKFLRTRLRGIYDSFAEDMAQSGCHYHVILGADELCAVHNRKVQTTSIAIDPNGAPQCVTRPVMVAAIRAHLARFRGWELPNELPERATRDIFRVLSSPWEQIAQNMANNSLEAARRFYMLVVQHVAPKAAKIMTDEIFSQCFHAIELNLKAKVGELLSPFRKGAPFTNSPAYSRRLAELNSGLRTQDYPDQAHLTSHLSLDTVLALYQTSEGTFMDNMLMLAVENCVVQPLKSILTTETILDIEQTDPEKFKRIAAESIKTERERDGLEHQIASLATARIVCNKHAFYQADIFDDPSDRTPAETVPGTRNPDPEETDEFRVTNRNHPNNAEAVDVGAADSSLSDSQKQYKTGVPTPRINTPEPEPSEDLFATRGDPAALTPPRTPESKPRATASRLGNTPEVGRRSPASISTSSFRNTGSGAFSTRVVSPHPSRSTQVVDGPDEEL